MDEWMDGMGCIWEKRKEFMFFFSSSWKEVGIVLKGYMGVRAQLWVRIFFLYIFVFNFCVFRWVVGNV